MTLTIKTNLSSLIVQQNLNIATNELTKSIHRMTTGYKINGAKDNAAGMSIATNWTTKLGSIEVAQENTQMGIDLLNTAEENYSLITAHLQRVRDLTEQAANGTYGSDSLKAIQAEIQARLEEIDRIAENCEYNGIKLLNGDNATDGILLQVGITEKTSESQIAVSGDNFGPTKTQDLLGDTIEKVAEACVDPTTVLTELAAVDEALNTISKRLTTIGATQNKLDSADSSLATQYQNITSSLSTIKDTDVASESSKYISAQILQQASATLLATANQTPSIALSLL